MQGATRTGKMYARVPEDESLAQFRRQVFTDVLPLGAFGPASSSMMTTFSPRQKRLLTSPLIWPAEGN